MVMQTLLKNLIFSLVKNIFEMLLMQYLLRYLPQRDQKMPGEM